MAPAPTGRTPLHALAHPLRSRLVAHLRVHGAQTATTLAQALGTNTGATSYHLRALESAGLVEEAPGGTGRQRWWQLVEEPHAARDSGDAPDDEDDAALAAWLQHDYVEHFAEHAHRWVDASAGADPDWVEACGLVDAPVLVTTEQLSALRAELDAVLARYRRVGAGTPGARRVAAYACLLPVDPAPEG